MDEAQDLIKTITKRIKSLNPDKIILFGSYAIGEPNENSDIDIYIVTKDDFIPNSWREKIDIYLEYSNILKDLQKIMPIDIVVHTRKMYEKMKMYNSSFYRKSIMSGIEL